MSRTGLQVEIAPLPPGVAPRPSWRWRALVGGVPVAGGVVSDPRAARAEGVRAWRRWRGLPAWEARGRESRASCALRGLSAHVVPLPGGGWGWSVSDQTRRFVSGQAASWPDARAAAEAAWAEAVAEWAGAEWLSIFRADGQDAGQDAP